MKTKQSFKFAGMFLFLFMCIGLASATTVLNVPVTNTNYTNIEFNITTDITNALSCSVYYDAAGGAAETLLGSITNDTDSDTDFTLDISIEDLVDGLVYNFTANCTGDSDEEATAVEAVGIDNTAPVISVERTSPGYIDYMTSVSVSCSATDATTSVTTTTRTLTKPSGETVTTTTTPYTFTGGDLNELGKYIFTCAAVDNPGNTNSDTVEFIVQSDDDIVDDIIDDTQQDRDNSNMLMFLLIFGAAAIIIIITILVITKDK